MRIALLSGANPRTATSCPKVRLSKGNWKVQYDGVVDSTFLIILTSKPFENPQEDVNQALPIFNGLAFDLEVPACAQLEFGHRGSEQTVSIIAERI